MAYNRATAGHTGTWYQEQMSMINASSAAELNELCDGFDMNFQNVASSIKTDSGINIMKDAKKMLDHPEIMQEYKTMLLDPIVNEIKEAAADTQDPGEKIHLESVAMQLDQAWDKNLEAFLVQESYNTSTYLPLATLDFPALIKQYIRFLGKDIIPVQNASSTNIEQRIFIKYLVNNQTGEEYEVPKVYWQKEADGTPTWKKLWNAGKGIKINDKDPILLSDIYSATNKKYDMFDHLLKDDGTAYEPGEFAPQKTLRTRLSYDFNIQYVAIDGEATDKYVLLTADNAPEDWPADATPSTKYFKNTGTAEAPVYTGVTSTDVYAKNTYYEKTQVTGLKKVKLPGTGVL